MPLSFDQHLYPYWPVGAPPRSKPLQQLFNTDSLECTLKSLDACKTLPLALCFPRSHQADAFPRTDDCSGPASRYDTTNFADHAAGAAFLRAVAQSQRTLFSVAYELLACDAPRRHRRGPGRDRGTRQADTGERRPERHTRHVSSQKRRARVL